MWCCRYSLMPELCSALHCWDSGASGIVRSCWHRARSRPRNSTKPAASIFRALTRKLLRVISVSAAWWRTSRKIHVKVSINLERSREWLTYDRRPSSEPGLRTSSQARSPHRPAAMALDPGLRASRRLIRPFPFCKPVPAASPFTLEFRHSSPALWTDQVDDRGNDLGVRFAR